MDVCSTMHYVYSDARLSTNSCITRINITSLHVSSYFSFFLSFLFFTFRRCIPNPRRICAHLGTREVRIHAVFLVSVSRMARVLRENLVIVDASTRFWMTPVPRILAVAWKRASRPPAIARTRLVAPESGNYYVRISREGNACHQRLRSY